MIKRDKVWRPYTSEELPDVDDSDSISRKGDFDMAPVDSIEI